MSKSVPSIRIKRVNKRTDKEEWLKLLDSGKYTWTSEEKDADHFISSRACLIMLFMWQVAFNYRKYVYITEEVED